MLEIHSKYRSMELIFTYQCLMLIFKFTDCKDFVLFYILVLGGKMFRCKEKKHYVIISMVGNLSLSMLAIAHLIHTPLYRTHLLVMVSR